MHEKIQGGMMEEQDKELIEEIEKDMQNHEYDLEYYEKKIKGCKARIWVDKEMIKNIKSKYADDAAQ